MPRPYKTYTPEELAVWIPALIAAGMLHRFYLTHAWQHLRREALKEQHYECQHCRAKGLATRAETVHHNKTVRQFPWLALTKSNLLCLCDECHYQIHHPKAEKWNDERW